MLRSLLKKKKRNYDSYFLGVFKEQDDVLGATEKCRDAGFSFHDVFTPYAVHGLERAMGLPQSKITWVTFLCGAMGATIGILGMGYVTWWDWPLNIGGKSPFPFPAFVPVMFELTVLIGGLCTMLALFALCRIFPGKATRLWHPRVTDDRFVVVLRCDDKFHENQARDIFEKHNAEEMKEVDLDYSVEPERGSK